MISGELRYRTYANYRQKINAYITFSKAFQRMMYNEKEYVIIENAVGCRIFIHGVHTIV